MHPRARTRTRTRTRTHTHAPPPHTHTHTHTRVPHTYARNQVPEQINVVLGQDNSVVLSFVTLWEPSFAANIAGKGDPLPPHAEYSYATPTTTTGNVHVPRSGATTAAAAATNLTRTGITHLYQSPQNLTDPTNRYWNLTARPSVFFLLLFVVVVVVVAVVVVVLLFSLFFVVV